MKIYLLLCLCFTMAFGAFAQAPTIEGDVMLCPDSNGTATITNNQEYDSYQWYFKYWFLNDDYAAIEGATSADFTYDWMTYDQALLKVVVTLDGQTYESNTIQVDSYAWASITVMHDFDEEQVIYDPEQGFLMCPGNTIVNTINSPYTVVQWYKDGQPIEGATGASYTITQPGTYYATAAPPFCPNATSNTLPLLVDWKPECAPQTVEAPVIAGDLMLCPDTNGTATVTNNQTYDTYQWYSKYWFTNDEYAAIEGATSASFTYDWNTYDQALIKLVVTVNGETFESNAIQIDSYQWAGLLVEHSYDEEQVYINLDNGHFMMCPGSSITNTVSEPYNTAQWYKDGVAIEGATGLTFVITEPGAYRVSASQPFCPNVINNGPEFIVELRDDCTAGLNNPDAKTFTLYPNPAATVLNVKLTDSIEAQYTVFDVTGKTLMTGLLNNNTSAIAIDGLAAGTYLIKVAGNGTESTKMFIKQ